MDVTRNIRYQGPPAMASALAQMLEEEGVRVDWAPPEERRGAGEIAMDLTVNLVAAGAWQAIMAGVARFRSRMPGPKVTVEGEDDTAGARPGPPS